MPNRILPVLLVASFSVSALTIMGCNSSTGGATTSTASNPAPSLTSISPASASVGSGDVTITLSGANFLNSSTVLWNSTELARVYLSATSLAAVVPASDLQSAGTATVTVQNPTPGGGTSSGVTFAINSQPNPVPTLSAISPSSATAGSSATTITLTGTNFVSTSTVQWNGNSLSTSFSSSTVLTATVPASLLTSAGSAEVTVVTPAPGGGTTSGLTFTINLPQTSGVFSVPITANDLAWDPIHQNIYLSLPSLDGANGNSVQALNPVTQALGAVGFAGSEPDLISVSANAKYLYVSLDGASAIQRLTLPDLSPDINISLGPSSFYGPYIAMDLQAAPNADETMAVVRGSVDVSPEEEGGVMIYDDGVSRPNVLCGWIEIPACPSTNNTIGLYDSIQWNSDASEMYIANNEDTGFDFYTVPVNASGFGTITDYPGLVQGFFGDIHYDPTTKYVYDDNGVVINPAAGSIVGTFDASGIMVPDGKLGTAFFIGQTEANAGASTYTIESFNMQKFTPIATLTIQNVTGVPTHLIRWGMNGLAFTTAAESGSTATPAVYLVSGSFVSSPPAAQDSKPEENVRRTWKPREVLKNFHAEGRKVVQSKNE